MNIRFKKSFEERFSSGQGMNSCCYRLMGILEQNIEYQDRTAALKEGRKPRKCEIKKEYISTGRNADLENFLRSVGISRDNFQAVALGKVPFNARQRADISRALGVSEDAIWY